MEKTGIQRKRKVEIYLKGGENWNTEKRKVENIFKRWRKLEYRQKEKWKIYLKGGENWNTEEKKSGKYI